jgi:hypothetical protein
MNELYDVCIIRRKINTQKEWHEATKLLTILLQETAGGGIKEDLVHGSWLSDMARNFV